MNTEFLKKPTLDADDRPDRDIRHRDDDCGCPPMATVRHGLVVFCGTQLWLFSAAHGFTHLAKQQPLHRKGPAYGIFTDKFRPHLRRLDQHSHRSIYRQPAAVSS